MRLNSGDSYGETVSSCYLERG